MLSANNLELGLEAYENNNYPQALKYLNTACDEKNSKACFVLGNLYNEGDEITQNVSKANQYYKKAEKLYINECNNENGKSCLNLAGIYKDGYGQIKKSKSDFYLYLSKGMPLQKKTCIKGDINMCYSTGVMYENGRLVEKDLSEAKEYFEIGCKLKSGASCHSLGNMYQFGSGVDKDEFKGLKYTKLGCSYGNSYACRDMAFYYVAGEIVRQNKSLAKEYFGKSCDLAEKFNDYNGCEHYKRLNEQGY